MPKPKSLSRIKNPEALASLGKQLRVVREAAGLAQSGVKNMRQGTVSKVENGLEVTLDTFVNYAASLGLEIALVPIGQATLRRAAQASPDRPPLDKHPAPADLLDEFDYLKDPE